MTDHIAVAISTTGDEHRLELLAQCVAMWRSAVSESIGYRHPTSLFVTIDGDENACDRVMDAVGYEPVEFRRVGQPWGVGPFNDTREGRLGVAVNKNTGLELMATHDAEHLFLSDDDIWPLSATALELHVSGNGSPLVKHSMVCWGHHRLGWTSNGPWAEWTWPRGSMLYTHRSVLDDVGGLVEAFGPGGHEHVEWSRRIHQAGHTPALYCSPLAYATHGPKVAMGASLYWHAEDMPREGEGIAAYRIRKRDLTSVRRQDGDWENIDQIMARQDHNTAFVPYRAGENGRASATLYHNHRA